MIIQNQVYLMLMLKYLKMFKEGLQEGERYMLKVFG